MLNTNWTLYQNELKSKKVPEKNRLVHKTIQEAWLRASSTTTGSQQPDPNRFIHIVTTHWKEWEQTVIGDNNTLKRTCGNILNSLLREWAVLPDQHLLRQIYNQVSKSSEGASIANGAL